jgi:uncharacterized protein YuzE
MKDRRALSKIRVDIDHSIDVEVGYVRFNDNKVWATIPLNENIGLIGDFDEEGRLIGIEFLRDEIIPEVTVDRVIEVEFD